MTELLPCPFCGGEAQPTAHLTYSWFAPTCKSCGVRGPSVRIGNGATPQQMRELLDRADALWNTRSSADCSNNLHVLTALADDACELMELSGMHDESAYKALKAALKELL